MRAGAAVLALALVTAAGCGGDDDGGLSKSEFITRADGICEKTEPPEQKPLKNAAQARKAAQAQVDYRRPVQAELSRLDPPDEVKADFEKFQAATRKAIDLFEQQVEAASKSQDARYGQLNRQLDPLFKQRDQLADEIGFKSCGQPVPPPS
jgi:arginyl-tRNA synthetase